MRLSNKTIKIVTNFALGVYLFILIANILHSHSHSFSSNNFSFISQESKSSHLINFGSENYCPIFLAFHSLANSTISPELNIELFNPITECILDFTLLQVFNSQDKIHYSLRAPPNFS